MDINTENLQNNPYHCQIQEDLNDHGFRGVVRQTNVLVLHCCHVVIQTV